MNVPDQLWDQLLLPASPSALRVALAILRHGRRQVDDWGNPTQHLRLSRPALARAAGVSKRSLDAGLTELCNTGWLRVHESNRPGASNGYSLALVMGANIAPTSQLEPPSHDHDDDATIPNQQGTSETSSSETTSALQLLHRLRDLGVNQPSLLITGYGLDRVRDVTLYVERLDSHVRNPGGLVRHILDTHQRVPETEPWEVLPHDSPAYRRALYGAAQ